MFKFSIDSLIDQKLQKTESSKPDMAKFSPFSHGAPNLISSLSPKSLNSHQIMLNMAMSSLNENFLDTLHARGLLPVQTHPIYAGALSTSLPGYMTHQNMHSLEAAKIHLLQQRGAQSWLAAQVDRTQLHPNVLFQSGKYMVTYCKINSGAHMFGLIIHLHVHLLLRHDLTITTLS